MRVSESPISLEVRDSDLRPMGTGRAPGLHLSDIINHLRMAIDPKFRAMKLQQIKKSGGTLYMAMGFLFEMVLTQAFAKYMGAQRTVRPNETESDGVFMNTDGINLEDGGVEEYKATYKSLKGLTLTNTRVDELNAGARLGEDEAIAIMMALENNFWHFLVQIKSYCRAWAATHAYLIVFFVCGDYSFPIQPRLVCLRLDFEPQELEGNWEMVVSNAPAVIEAMQERAEIERNPFPKPDDEFDRRFVA